jgi:hypothetical protein
MITTVSDRQVDFEKQKRRATLYKTGRCGGRKGRELVRHDLGPVERFLLTRSWGLAA